MTNDNFSWQWKGLCLGGAAQVHKLHYTRCATESRMFGKAKCFLVRKAVFQAITGYRLDVHSQTCGYPERVYTMQTEVCRADDNHALHLKEVEAESTISGQDVELVNSFSRSTLNSLQQRIRKIVETSQKVIFRLVWYW
jgi:hypothetical protein